jgi:cation diffusion facilitator CzcD-associated flavoprotein CzcO
MIAEPPVLAPTAEAPPHLDAETIIVGAGFAGLGFAMQLKARGEDSFLVLERASDVGGTWRDNVYPGCACDIPSMLYSYSFERNTDWTRVFPRQQELWDYLRACADKYRVRSHIRFNSELVEMRFDEATSTWLSTTRDGRAFRSRLLIVAMGPLNKPAYPETPGIEKFTGIRFHSAEWRHDVDLRGKRVAVIGTGASAIQFVPEIAPLAQKLTLFQRTAPWIIPRPDSAVGPTRTFLRKYLPGYAWAVRKSVYWMLEMRALFFTKFPKVLALAEKMATRHIERQIADPELRAKVTPDYRFGCKRVLISDDYYPALARENVEVVTNGIREFRERSIVTDDGAEHPVDVVIFGTGFRATDGIVPVKAYGRGGLELNEAWRNGMEAYLGTNVAGFPNLFMIIGPNTGLGHNSMVFMMEAQYRYLHSAMDLMKSQRLREIEVKRDVQDAFNARIQSSMKNTVWNSGCKSWYVDKNGKNVTLWPGFTFSFRAKTKKLVPSNYSMRTLEAPLGSEALPV